MDRERLHVDLDRNLQKLPGVVTVSNINIQHDVSQCYWNVSILAIAKAGQVIQLQYNIKTNTETRKSNVIFKGGFYSGFCKDRTGMLLVLQ